MAFAPQVFGGITQQHFSQISVEVQKETGIAVSGNSGTATQSGFTLSWNFDPSTGMLSISVLDKPWIVPNELIQQKIRELVEGD